MFNYYITDTAPSNVSTADIDNQSSNNYLYDNNGNMIADKQNNIDFILYDIFNLPVEFYLPGSLHISYDENGQKILTSYEDDIKTYYVNSPTGENEEVVKDYGPITFNILGNGNIGQIDKDGSSLTRYYYLKDHLGSIKMRIKTDGSIDSYACPPKLSVGGTTITLMEW